MPSMILAFFRECGYGLRYPFVALLSYFYHPQWYQNPHPTKGTIIMVFCWFTPNNAHYKWVSYLEKAGYRTYLVNVPLLFEDFDATAKRLEQFIIEHNCKNYTLVGISTGALVCWYFLHVYGKWHEIHRFISLGGPVHGTPTAWFISYAKKGRDMLPGSRFIRQLENTPILPKKIVTLSAAWDELVPRKNSQLNNTVSYILPILGHNKFHLGSKEVYELIAKLAEEKNT